jgi:hypothetical protein
VKRLIDRDLMFGNLVEVSTPTLVAIDNAVREMGRMEEAKRRYLGGRG